MEDRNRRHRDCAIKFKIPIQTQVHHKNITTHLKSKMTSFSQQVIVSNKGKYIENIYFFEVNTKYISSSELKTSKFSRVRSTSENLDVLMSRDEIYLVFSDKK